MFHLCIQSIFKTCSEVNYRTKQYLVCIKMILTVFVKIGHSNFKYEDKHVFEDCRNYKAIQGLWELLTKSKPDKMRSLFRTDKHINKYSCSLTSRELISPRRKTKTNKGLKYKQFISQLFNDKNQVLGNRYINYCG
jgi:hypothetical protein